MILLACNLKSYFMLYQPELSNVLLQTGLQYDSFMFIITRLFRYQMLIVINYFLIVGSISTSSNLIKRNSNGKRKSNFR